MESRLPRIRSGHFSRENLNLHNNIRRIQGNINLSRIGRIKTIDLGNNKLLKNLSLPANIAPSFSMLTRDINGHLKMKGIDMGDVTKVNANDTNRDLTDPMNNPIEELELSIRTYIFLKRANICTVGDFLQLTDAQIENMKNITKGIHREIINKKSEIAFKNRDLTDPMNNPIEELELSIRTYIFLKRANICTVGDFLQLTDAQIENMKNITKGIHREIKQRLIAYRISFE